MPAEFWLESVKGRDILEDLGIYRRISPFYINNHFPNLAQLCPENGVIMFLQNTDTQLPDYTMS
jgi:hypothetical protein